MQDAILEATVKFILKSPENLELALHVEKALPGNGEAVARNVILQATDDFISGSDQNRELARRVVEAMPAVRTEFCRRLLCAVEEGIEQQKPDGWEIRSSYKDDSRNLMKKRSYLALRRNCWGRENILSHYTSGVQLLTERGNWNEVWLGVCFPQDCGEPPHNDIKQNVLTEFMELELAIAAPWERDLVNGDMDQMWRAYRFQDWGKEDFMMTAISNLDEIAVELTDGLVCLARLVDDHLPPFSASAPPRSDIGSS